MGGECVSRTKSIRLAFDQGEWFQTVLSVPTGVLKPLYYRLTLISTLTSLNLSLHIIIPLYWLLYIYAAHAADILTQTTVVQGVGNHSWGLYCRRCWCIYFCLRRCCRIFHFSHWLGQLSTDLIKAESPYTGYTFTLYVVSFSPLSIVQQVGGT